MIHANFPVIGPAECRSYIASARLTENAVARRIREMLCSRMIQECAWCGKFIGTIACAPEQHGKVSHGICPACKELNFPQQVASEAGESHKLSQDGSTPSPAPNFTAAGDERPVGVAGASSGAGGGDPTFPVPVLAEPWQRTATASTHQPLSREERSGSEARESTCAANGGDSRGGENLSSAIGELENGKSDAATDINGPSARPALD